MAKQLNIFNAILQGAARLLDLAGEEIRVEIDDGEALRSDWEAVGGDIRWAIGAFEDKEV